MIRSDWISLLLASRDAAEQAGQRSPRAERLWKVNRVGFFER